MDVSFKSIESKEQNESLRTLLLYFPMYCRWICSTHFSKIQKYLAGLSIFYKKSSVEFRLVVKVWFSNSADSLYNFFLCMYILQK